jgi:hypothetical protein
MKIHNCPQAGEASRRGQIGNVGGPNVAGSLNVEIAKRIMVVLLAPRRQAVSLFAIDRLD